MTIRSKQEKKNPNCNDSTQKKKKKKNRGPNGSSSGPRQDGFSGVAAAAAPSAFSGPECTPAAAPP